MKVAFSILNMPDGTWHYVMRLWEHGLGQACTIYPAAKPYKTPRAALDDASREYSEKIRAAAGRAEAKAKT